MKKYDVVKLTNLIEVYKQNNLYLNAQGIVLDCNNEKSKVLFVNEYNQGDYAYLEVKNNDVEIISNDTPLTFVNYIKENLKNFMPKEKGFKKKEFEVYSQVELLVENERYSKFGVHKGNKGVIMEDYAVKDYVLVDFGRIDKNNNYFGDCISVRLKDIQILEENKD